VSDRVAGITAGNPVLGAAASEQGTEIIRPNQNPLIHCQGNHLLWSGSAIELRFNVWIAYNLMKKVIQRIQQW
jgi:hypothetical protein